MQPSCPTTTRSVAGIEALGRVISEARYSAAPSILQFRSVSDVVQVVQAPPLLCPRTASFHFPKEPKSSMSAAASPQLDAHEADVEKQHEDSDLAASRIGR